MRPQLPIRAFLLTAVVLLLLLVLLVAGDWGLKCNARRDLERRLALHMEIERDLLEIRQANFAARGIDLVGWAVVGRWLEHQTRGILALCERLAVPIPTAATIEADPAYETAVDEMCRAVAARRYAADRGWDHLIRIMAQHAAALEQLQQRAAVLKKEEP